MVRKILTALAFVALAACHDGNNTTDTTVPTSAPASSTGSAPTISGVPVTRATVGSAYSFTPSAQDADGQALTFAIQNKPTWASFDQATGRLSGTPAAADAGVAGGIMISVSDGANTVSLPAFSILIAAAGNSAPVISGAPRKSVAVGQSYTFTPSASSGSGEPLTFSIVNKPSWATFNESTGQLSGTPGAADVGTFSNIVISVTDGVDTADLAAFDIAVTQIGSGSATLTWVPPTQNVDGTALTDLSGYRIHYGLSKSALTETVTISSSGVTNYVVSNLSPATWYFTVKAFNSKNVESDNSAVVSKVIQ